MKVVIELDKEEEFKDVLRKLAEDKGISISKLAAQAGISRQLMYSYLNGISPRYKQICSIFAALGYKIAFIKEVK